jgi:hypothetical protein
MHLFNMPASYNSIHEVFIFDGGDLTPKNLKFQLKIPKSDSDK